MKRTSGLYAGAAVMLLLAGCASVTQPPAGTGVPGAQPPQAQPQLPLGQTLPGQPPQPPEAGARPVIEAPARTDMSQNRAVLALLDRAQAETDAGNRDAAGASLERALHIEPRNPWVWEQLAQVRLGQGNYDLAISLARKSNSFSGGKRRVQAVNWQLIGQARVAKGDAPGADEAFKKAADLAELAKAEK